MHTRRGRFGSSKVNTTSNLGVKVARQGSMKRTHPWTRWRRLRFGSQGPHSPSKGKRQLQTTSLHPGVPDKQQTSSPHSREAESTAGRAPSRAPLAPRGGSLGPTCVEVNSAALAGLWLQEPIAASNPTASPPARTAALAAGLIPACVARASRGLAVRRWPRSRCTSVTEVH